GRSTACMSASTKHKHPSDQRYHLDRRAHVIAATIDDNDKMLNTRELAELLGVSTQWVEIERCKGSGPPFVRLGPRMVRYRRNAVRAWLKQRARISYSYFIKRKEVV